MSEDRDPNLQVMKREPLAEIEIESNDKVEIILRHMMNKKYEQLSNPLQNHTIQPGLRAKMADWMIEIITIFNLKQRTYFLAVNIMDHFLKNSRKAYPSKSMHLIGVSCMIVASKFNDSRYITPENAHRYVSCGQLSVSDIIEMESEIVKISSKCIGTTTCYDIASVLCEKYSVNKIVRRTTVTILYLLQLYYDSLKINMKTQAFSAFIISLCTIGHSGLIEQISTEENYDIDLRQLNAVYAAVIKFKSTFPNFSTPTRFLDFEFNPKDSIELFTFRPSDRFD